MRFVNNTPEDEIRAREEIQSCLDKNMFVEAGAGAGKTYLIVERIINMLKNGYAPREIVVITFTNAAAEELRMRISGKVRDVGLTEAMNHLDEMNISTIHSFCNVLLKEQAVSAGLPTDIGMIDEDEDKAIKLRVLNGYLSSFTQDDWERLESVFPERRSRWQIRQFMEELYLNILKQPGNIDIKIPDEKSADDAVALFYDKFSTPDEKKFDKIKQDIEKKIIDLAVTVKSDLTDIDTIMDDEKLPSENLKKIVELLNGKDLAGLNIYLVDTPASKNKLFKSVKLKAYNADMIAAVNEEWLQFVKDMYKDIISNKLYVAGGKKEELLKNAYGVMLTHHALRAASLYEEKRPVGSISNSRLLWETYKMICNDEDNRAHRFFAKKYRSFFVDEFQDTDGIQAGFIYRLATDPDDASHKKLRDGSLFAVGDPKQSIYRFTGAQPEVFFEIRDKMAELDNATVYELHKNFRSNRKLIGWINEKFEDADGILLDENGDPVNDNEDNILYIVDKDHPYSQMDPKDQGDDKADKKSGKKEDRIISGAYKYLFADSYSETQDFKYEAGRNHEVKDGTEYVPAEYLTVKDAEDVKNLILNLVNGDYMIADPKGEKPYRKIRYSDFLLMTHKKTGMAIYLEALKSAGIPVRFSGNSELKSDPVLITFMRIYRHLINPSDDFYRVSAIEAIRESRLVDKVKDLDAYADGLLDLLLKKTRGMTAYGVAEYLEKQFSAFLKKDTDISYIDFNVSMTRIRQMLENLYEKVQGTGITFITAMMDYISKGTEHELSLEETPNSVNFMNLHKTKGLQGKIVIIADRNDLMWDKSLSDYRDGNVYYPGVGSSNVWSSATLFDADIKDRHIKEDKAEFHRLEYVAVTRAEEAVIFMNTVKPRCIFANCELKKSDTLKRVTGVGDGYDYHLNDLPDVKDVIESRSNPARIPKAEKKYDIATETMFEKTEEGPDKRHNAIYEKLSPSLMETPDKDRKIRQELKKEASASGKKVSDDMSATMKRPVDNVVGNVLHRTMELMVNRYTASAASAPHLEDMCVQQAVDENMIDIVSAEEREDYTADEVKEFIIVCAASYRKWLDENGVLNNAEAVYTELPFSYYEDKDASPDGNDVFMKGNADLIIKYTDGSVLLIDYKSDNDWQIPEDRMIDVLGEKYLPQLNVYRHMISKLLNVSEDMIKVAIVSFSQKDEKGCILPGKEVRTRYSDLTDYKLP